MSRETPPAECPSCGDRLVSFTWSDYQNHLADHDDRLTEVILGDPDTDVPDGRLER